MTFQLTWWEYDELLEHLQSREDIWTCSDDNEFLWLRTQPVYHEETDEFTTTNGCALQFSPPSDGDSAFRLYSLDAHLLEWTEEHCKDYVTGLLDHWTTYSLRSRVQKFMTADLQLADEMAMIAAIAVTSFDHSEERKDPDGDEPVIRPSDVVVYDQFPRLPDPFDVGTWLLAGGGYVKLRLNQNVLSVTLSIPSLSDGFPYPLKGVVRPLTQSVQDYVKQITKRKDVHADETSPSSQPVDVEELRQLQAPLRMETDPELRTGGETERPGDRDGDA